MHCATVWPKRPLASTPSLSDTHGRTSGSRALSWRTPIVCACTPSLVGKLVDEGEPKVSDMTVVLPWCKLLRMPVSSLTGYVLSDVCELLLVREQHNMHAGPGSTEVGSDDAYPFAPSS